MKRRIFAIVVVALVGCSAPEPATAPTTSGVESWVTPPVIDAVERDAGGLWVRGRAAAQGRIVLRGTGDIAYAVGADDQGRFEVLIQPPATDTLFVVETQVGQDAAPAPYRLLVARDPKGPVALIGFGAPTIRLDPTRGLHVIDDDGRSQLASGQGEPGQAVRFDVNGTAVTGIVSDQAGRWTAALPPVQPPVSLTVADVGYQYPGRGEPGQIQALAVTEGGWRYRLRLSATAYQDHWFPAGSRP